jgi:hypothetical protein
LTNTSVDYVIDFDSTIVKLNTKIKMNDETISEGISEDISERFEKRGYRSKINHPVINYYAFRNIFK